MNTGASDVGTFVQNAFAESESKLRIPLFMKVRDLYLGKYIN
jgi:hypothetical protein